MATEAPITFPDTWHVVFVLKGRRLVSANAIGPLSLDLRQSRASLHYSRHERFFTQRTWELITGAALRTTWQASSAMTASRVRRHRFDHRQCDRVIASQERCQHRTVKQFELRDRAHTSFLWGEKLPDSITELRCHYLAIGVVICLAIPWTGRSRNDHPSSVCGLVDSVRHRFHFS